MRCPRCGNENPAGQRFCGDCGNELAAGICGSCGFANPPSQRFCGNCGSPLAAAIVSPAAPVDAAGPLPVITTERRLVSVLFADLVGFTCRGTSTRAGGWSSGTAVWSRSSSATR
jgi:hypothetical protein